VRERGWKSAAVVAHIMSGGVHARRERVSEKKSEVAVYVYVYMDGVDSARVVEMENHPLERERLRSSERRVERGRSIKERWDEMWGADEEPATSTERKILHKENALCGNKKKCKI
jgi:hypothetical protein